MITTQTRLKRQPVTVETPVYRLMRGQRVLHNGTVLKVARVFACFSRESGWHVHLLPLDYEPLPGWESYDPNPWSQPETPAEAKARAHEAQHLIRVPCPEDGTLPVVLEDWDLRTDIQGNDHLTYGEEPPVFSYRVQLKSPNTNGDKSIALKTLHLLTDLQQWQIPELVNRCYRGYWLYCHAQDALEI
ncbi:MAG: hypothetical protein AAF215_32370 [Cyanobacteria bacterium P01_A01_bin.123]